ncbi:putative porin [Pseudomonadota bacterium]
MKKLTVLFGLILIVATQTAVAQVDEDEIKLLRQQIELLTNRLDRLEKQNQQLVQTVEQSNQQAAAKTEAVVDEKVDAAVTEKVDEKMAAVSWAERIRWSGDFRYRYENIDVEDSDSRSRSRIRARTHLEADLSPTLQVGIGLATGGDDPVSSNQTIGGAGSSKDVKLDLAYFDWSGLENTHIVGGKVKNFLIRPAKKGLRWDGDWRPEGLGIIWDNDFIFAQALGTWLEGDSKNGTEFAWAVQGGFNFKTGDFGKMKIGGGYTVFNIAGRTPIYGEEFAFYGNSYVINPITGLPEFAYDYRNWEAFAEWKISDFTLFANYTVNTEVDDNDTGYLFGAKYGSAKDRGTWDITYFYEKIEADSTVGLLADSDFGGGGTDAKGHVFSGTYAFHKNWNFKATYFLNKIDIASADDKDFDRLQLDLNFKFK